MFRGRELQRDREQQPQELPTCTRDVDADSDAAGGAPLKDATKWTAAPLRLRMPANIRWAERTVERRGGRWNVSPG
jgi:hypothetical protein